MFKWLEKNLPKIVIAPSIGLISWFVYGFILWTFYISFTNSKILPKYELWGVQQYVKLWGLRKWHIAVENLLIFTILFLIICIVIGLLLAILLDQKINQLDWFILELNLTSLRFKPLFCNCFGTRYFFAI